MHKPSRQALKTPSAAPALPQTGSSWIPHGSSNAKKSPIPSPWPQPIPAAPRVPKLQRALIG